MGLSVSRSRFARVLAATWLQLALLFTLTIAVVLESRGVLDSAALVQRASNMLVNQGLWLVPLFAFLEYVAFVNVYFPGSVVLILALSAARDQEAKMGIALLVYAGACIAQLVNYSIGRRTAATAFTVPLPRLIAMYVHPNTSVLASLEAGRSGMSPSRFLSVMMCAGAAWGCIWVALLAWGSEWVARGSRLWLVVSALYLMFWIAREVRGLEKAEAANR